MAQDEPFDVFERFWITPGYGPGLMPGSIEVVQTSEHRPHNLRITGSCRLQPLVTGSNRPEATENRRPSSEREGLVDQMPTRAQDLAKKDQGPTKNRVAIAIRQMLERSPEKLENMTMVIKRLM